MKRFVYSAEQLNQFSTFEISNVAAVFASDSIESSQRFITDVPTKEIFCDAVFEFINEAYDELGGFKSFKDKSSFINDSYLWYITYDGPEPASDIQLDLDRVLVISVYRSSHGLKMVGIARRKIKQLDSLRPENQEIRTKANAALAAHLKFMAKRGWAEVSDKLETWCHRILSDQWIINPQYLIVNKIFKNIEIDPYEECHYYRFLRKGGPKIHKIAYGTVKI